MAELSIEQRRAMAMASARLRMQAPKPDPKKPTEFEAEAQATVNDTPAEIIAGSAPVRFAMGAASPFIGLSQLASKALSGVSEFAGASPFRPKETEEIKNRGMEALGQEGYDFAGLAGTVMSPAALKVAKALSAPATAGKRIAQGAVVGGSFGAATPVTEEGDFATQKAIQTGLGVAAGAAIPAGGELLKAGGRSVRDTLDLVAPGGAERIATRYQRSLVGQENRDLVADALRNARELVPGAKPTAAEAVAHLPAGSPVIAQQRITAAQPGGISAKFGERAIDQKNAITAAIEARNVATKPMREAALAGANAGGVKAQSVTDGIDATLSKPGIRASDVVSRTLNSVKEKIASLTDDGGTINADDLYTIRKEIGNTIKTHAKDTANWDKKLTSGLERDIQKGMDDAIEAAGGKGWKDYLATFAEKSKGIEADLARKKAMLKPPQRTNVAGGLNVAEETRAHLPNMLSRPAMLANAVLRYAGAGVEPRVDRVMADQFLNPVELAKALQTATPAQRKVIEAMMQNFGQAPVVGAATAAAGTQ